MRAVEAQSIEQKEEKIKQGIESLDAPEISVKEEKLGNLEIVDEPTDEQLELERERLAKLKQEDTEKVEPKARKFKGPGIKTTSDMEREIDAKVERILHPKEEAEEEPKKEARPKQSRDEPKDLLEASMEENEDKEPDSEDQKYYMPWDVIVTEIPMVMLNSSNEVKKYKTVKNNNIRVAVYR